MLTARILLYVSGGLLACCLVLGVVLYAQNVRLGACKNEVDARELEVKALRQRVDEFRLVIAEQNKSIDGLKRASDERAAAADAALASARADAAKGLDARRRLASLLASPTPPGAKCEAAVAAVRKDLKK